MSRNNHKCTRTPHYMLVSSVVVVMVVLMGFLGRISTVQAFTSFFSSSSTSRFCLNERQQQQQPRLDLSRIRRTHDHLGGCTTAAEVTRLCLSMNDRDRESSSGNDSGISATTSLTNIWKTLQEKPGGLIILPFVIIFGLDLFLNIIFVTKRSIEFFVLGEAPSQETWF
jgi:hypothetical protein